MFLLFSDNLLMFVILVFSFAGKAAECEMAVHSYRQSPVARTASVSLIMDLIRRRKKRRHWPSIKPGQWLTNESHLPQERMCGTAAVQIFFRHPFFKLFFFIQRKFVNDAQRGDMGTAY